MSLVELTEFDDVALLRMQDGVTNPISPDMLRDFDICLEQVRGRCRGMVLAGEDKFFSIGLDLPGLLKLDKAEFVSFWHSFLELQWDLFTLPMPTASAVKGHAIAGGTILALMTDYRFLASGKPLMGLNEVKLGIPAPYLPQMMLERLLPDNQAKEMLYAGEFIKPDQAAAFGLVDKLCGPDECEKAALDKVSALAMLPAKAFARIKQSRLEVITARYRVNGERLAEEFIELWFKPETQALLEKAAEKF
jgi:enoyl-CoA hydratase/carnithine racemase